MATIDPTLRDPKEITVGGKQFLLSKLPATVGREVLLAYTAGQVEDGISYDKVPLEKSIRLLSYASVKAGESWVRLSTAEVIDAHISNVMDYIELEKAMLGHSMDFSSTVKS